MSLAGPKVWDVMSRDVIAVAPETRRAEVAERLRTRHISQLPVVNEHMQVVGTVGPGELRRRQGRFASQLMVHPASTVDEESPVSVAADLLLNRRLASVPVVNHGKLVGRISRSGLVAFLCLHQWVCPACGNAQRGLSPPLRCGECGGPASDFRLEEAMPGL